MWLLLLGAFAFVLSTFLTKEKRASSDTNGCLIMVYIILGTLALAAVIVMLQGGSRSDTKGTDGVFESATEKMDKGTPLNAREKQRINDILNYKENGRAKEIERRHGE